MARRRTIGHQSSFWLEGIVGRFLLGFIVAIVIVLFIVVQCAQALF